MMDTGADMRVVTEQTVKKMKIPIQKSNKTLCGPDGNKLEIIVEMIIDLVSSSGSQDYGSEKL